jgi:hypothetical protein
MGLDLGTVFMGCKGIGVTGGPAMNQCAYELAS